MHLHLVDEIADVLNSEWGDLAPWSSKDAIRSRLLSGATSAALPHTAVAVTEIGELAATGSIKLRELAEHTEMQYWLGEIFVLPEYRNQGLGKRLTNELAKHAFGHGVKRLYLYTPDKQALYRKLGWIELSESSVNGEAVTLMVRKSDA